jgi:hypothetical protein
MKSGGNTVHNTDVGTKWISLINLPLPENEAHLIPLYQANINYRN